MDERIGTKKKGLDWQLKEKKDGQIWRWING